MIVTATLDDVCYGSAIDLQVSCKVPPEIGCSDNYQATTRLSRLRKGDCKEQNENDKNSAHVTL
jgi:hypothetical protein